MEGGGSCCDGVGGGGPRLVAGRRNHHVFFCRHEQCSTPKVAEKTTKPINGVPAQIGGPKSGGASPSPLKNRKHECECSVYKVCPDDPARLIMASTQIHSMVYLVDSAARCTQSPNTHQQQAPAVLGNFWVIIGDHRRSSEIIGDNRLQGGGQWVGKRWKGYRNQPYHCDCQ